ncbi:MAG: tyrosine-type recombinase/integrase [Treponema sp.]|nr:tyrosine-type recombinase/integrase [Treponema sp.]
MILQDAIEEFLIYLSSVRTLSENTVIGYRNDFVYLTGYTGTERELETIKKEELLTSIGLMSQKKMAAASINRYIAAVRTLFAYCKKMGYIEKNPALELKNVKLPKRLPKFLTEKEVDDLCMSPEVKEILWETRDKAVFEMLYSSGCRVSELANLKFSDFTDGFHAALIRGKGKKDRYVYFADDAQSALSNYLDDRKQLFVNLNKEDNCEFVFINQRGGHLSVRGITWILSRYSGPEGTNHQISPHALRHTFATAMLANGADVRLVQELLGHSSVSTTQRYTHITTEKLIETYNKAHPHGGNAQKTMHGPQLDEEK